nr:hypothetical protein [Clostridium botulinum]
MREVMCFLYRYWSCCFTKDKEKALKDTLEFNKGFTLSLIPLELKLDKLRRHMRNGYTMSLIIKRKKIEQKKRKLQNY